MLTLNDAAHSAEQYSAFLEQHLDQRRQRIEQLDTFVRHRIRLYRQAEEQVQKQKNNKTIETVVIRPPSAPGDGLVVLSQRRTPLKEDSSTKFQQIEPQNRIRASKQKLASKQLVQTEQNSSSDDRQTIGTWLHPAPKQNEKLEQAEQNSTISVGSSMRRSMSETRLSSFALKALSDSISNDLNHSENRKRLQATRHLFMTMERRQIKEAMMLSKKNKQMKRLIELKEAERLHQEENLAQRQVTVVCDEDPVDVNSTDPQQLAIRHQQRTREQKRRELERYIRALKVTLKERCSQRSINVPSMCSCHETVWEADPKNCSQNCSFYQNYGAFATSLHSLLASCQATS